MRAAPGSVLKRSIDVIGAAILLALTAPVIVLSAATIRLASPGPVLFRQRRFGYRGAQFEMLKLRSMHLNSAELLTVYLTLAPERQVEWEQFGRLRNDPRLIPVVGRFLRSTSLDELPQLWNVLRGDMSLVGPRPLDVTILEQVAPIALERRAEMRPGITGLWQVSGRSDLDLDTMMALDARYVEEWSLWKDIAILCRTPAALVSQRGAY